MLRHLFRYSPRPCVLLSLLIVLPGCAGEDQFGGAETAIAGRVVDPVGAGISSVEVGIEYLTGPAPVSAPVPTPGPVPLAPSSAAAGSVSLGAPYPNPATSAIIGGEIRIPIAVSGDTTFSVSIYAPSGGVFEFVRELPAQGATQDTTVLWDGRGFGGYLPNGLYLVRLSVPADPPVGTAPTVSETTVLINRPAGLMESTAMNAESDIAGEYLIGDIPIGVRFPATNSQGTPLGTHRVSENVILVFRSPDYLSEDVPIFIGPGDFLSISTTLNPIFPTAGISVAAAESGAPPAGTVVTATSPAPSAAP